MFPKKTFCCFKATNGIFAESRIATWKAQKLYQFFPNVLDYKVCLNYSHLFCCKLRTVIDSQLS